MPNYFLTTITFIINKLQYLHGIKYNNILHKIFKFNDLSLNNMSLQTIIII